MMGKTMSVAIISEGRRGQPRRGGWPHNGSTRSGISVLKVRFSAAMNRGAWCSRRAVRAWLLAAYAVGVAAAAHAQGNDYRIGPQDVLAVRIYETPELNAEEIRVSTEGRITLPKAGAITVGGLTEPDAALEIK